VPIPNPDSNIQTLHLSTPDNLHMSLTGSRTASPWVPSRIISNQVLTYHAETISLRLNGTSSLRDLQLYDSTGTVEVAGTVAPMDPSTIL